MDHSKLTKLVFVGYNLTSTTLESASLVSGEIKNANYLLRELKNSSFDVVSISVNLWGGGGDGDYNVAKSRSKGVLRWVHEGRQINRLLAGILNPGDVLYLTVPSYLPFLKVPPGVRIAITAHGTYWPELKADLKYERSVIKRLLHLANGCAQLGIDRLSFRRAHRIHSVSEFQVQEMISTYGSAAHKIFTIRNGTAFVNYNPGGKRKYDVCWVGRLAKKKNLALFRDFLEARPQLGACLCVGNSYFAIDSASSHIAEQLSVSGRAVVHENLSDEALNRMLSECSVLIVTSTGYESIPTVIYEGLASGCRVVAPQSWGVAEVEGSGLFTYDEGDLSSLSRAYDAAISTESQGGILPEVRWEERANEFSRALAA